MYNQYVKRWKESRSFILFMLVWVVCVVSMFLVRTDFGTKPLGMVSNGVAPPLPPPPAEPLDWQQAPRRIGTLETEGSVNSMAFHPRGHLLAVGTGRASRGNVEWWHLAKGQRITIFADNRLTRSDYLAITPDGTQLIATGNWSSDRAIVLWDLDNRVPRRVLSGYRGTLHPAGTMVAGFDAEDTLTLWQIEDRTVVTTFMPTTTRCCRSIGAITWHPAGHTLAGVTGRSTVTLWNIASPTPQHTLTLPRGDDEDARWSLGVISFSPDGQFLAGGTRNGRIILWQVADGAVVQNLHNLPPETYITDLAFSPDGTLLAVSAEEDQLQPSEGQIQRGHVQLWRVPDGTHLHTWQAHEWGVESIAFSPDGTTLASGGKYGGVYFWRP